MKQFTREYIVCPKCKETALDITEVSEARETWRQDDEGNLIPPETDGAMLGAILRVEAKCTDPECGHTWTVRGIKDVEQLPNWNQETTEDAETYEEGSAEDEEEIGTDEAEVAEAEDEEEIEIEEEVDEIEEDYEDEEEADVDTVDELDETEEEEVVEEVKPKKKPKPKKNKQSKKTRGKKQKAA